VATPAIVLNPVARSVSVQPAERRAHPRLSAGELRDLKIARVKYGPRINVIDLSAGGILFETPEALRGDSIIVFEFAGRTSTVVVPSRLLRCEPIADHAGIRHKVACAFRRPLALDDFIAAAQPATGKGRSSSWQRVVARFRDGRLSSGVTNDFHPSKPYLNLSTTPTSGDTRFMQISQMEALYFLRDGGEEGRLDSPVSASAMHGRQIEVTLPNGDTIVGSTLNYRRDGNGFFVHPFDPRSEHSRVFVTTAGVRHVRFL
jgi:hypothetical protein